MITFAAALINVWPPISMFSMPSSNVIPLVEVTFATNGYKFTTTTSNVPVGKEPTSNYNNNYTFKEVLHGYLRWRIRHVHAV